MRRGPLQHTTAQQSLKLDEGVLVHRTGRTMQSCCGTSPGEKLDHVLWSVSNGTAMASTSNCLRRGSEALYSTIGTPIGPGLFGGSIRGPIGSPLGGLLGAYWGPIRWPIRHPIVA